MGSLRVPLSDLERGSFRRFLDVQQGPKKGSVKGISKVRSFLENYFMGIGGLGVWAIFYLEDHGT